MSLYKNPNFSLDALKREVRDENDKLARVAGNPYRLLELLCDRYPASLTITDINLALDPAGAREYTEAHVRRMKNVIHTALGQEVITYRNHVYSIAGELRKISGNDVTKEGISFKKPGTFNIRKLRTISVLKMRNRLQIHAKTSGGGSLRYTNEKFEGIL